MYKDQSVCVVVPAYKEETQIAKVLTTLPSLVDHIVVVDDASPDKTSEIVKQHAEKDKRIVLLRHEVNQGVGAAIASGYEWARDKGCQLTVVMAGDGQMCPADLPQLLDPVADGRADVSKGNRLFSGEAYRTIPRIRYFGNGTLSLLTKIASGYWNIADSQSGYVVVNKAVLDTIDWRAMYKRYGQPNDLLVRLNVSEFRVIDVHIDPTYDIGEESGIKIHRVLFTISWLLFRMFWWRMKEKYVIRDFHPLVLFYVIAHFFAVVALVLGVRMLCYWATHGYIPPINALAAMFSFVTATQFSLFAMWFDMEANKDLKGEPA